MHIVLFFQEAELAWVMEGKDPPPFHFSGLFGLFSVCNLLKWF